jgi:rRNA maturation RNase YbeY
MILNRQRTVRVARSSLELFLRRVREQLGLGNAGVTICLVSDLEIARMNESFRKKKGPTDVLSFPAKTRRKPLPVRRGRDANGAVVAAADRLPRASKGGGRLSIVKATNKNNHDTVREGQASLRSATNSVRHRALWEGTASSVPKRAMKLRASAPEADFLGDIAISPATARRNAKKFHRTLPSELQILILHGVLHLLGYDHETDRGQMTRKENHLRRRLGLS